MAAIAKTGGVRSTPKRGISKGEMLRKLSRDDEASQCFSRRFTDCPGTAKSFDLPGHYEPRSLAAGYRPPRRSARDARQSLQLVTEGFDSVDLKDARALLEVLEVYHGTP
jgi:hypothetical protein